VVPEIACRKHIENIIKVVRDSLSQADRELADLDAIAVTYGPGLVGALLVGIGVAKAISYSCNKPLIALNHLEGHLLSALLIPNEKIEFPFVSLIVSGGHTSLFLARGLGDYELVGRTVDDAAGEAFDKVAKALGLPYPGGPVIEALSGECAGDEVAFPSPMIKHKNYNFSFSGLKTAVLNYLRFDLGITSPDEARGMPRGQLSIIAAGFQSAVFNVLIEKTLRFACAERVELITLGGGVSANGALRERFSHAAVDAGIRLVAPGREFCTDNGAMIGCAAYHHYQNGQFAGLALDAEPNLKL